jgi:hypothetical protein
MCPNNRGRMMGWSWQLDGFIGKHQGPGGSNYGW